MLSFVHCCAAAIQLSRSVYSVSVIVHLLHLPVCPEENCSSTVSCRASKPVSVKAQVSSHIACIDAEYFFFLLILQIHRPFLFSLGFTDARHQVTMQLLHSEWEYVSTLNQLYDKYKTPPAHHMTAEP